MVSPAAGDAEQPPIVLSRESSIGVRLWTSITGSVEVVPEAGRSRLSQSLMMVGTAKINPDSKTDCASARHPARRSERTYVVRHVNNSLSH
jgi:hypothetical protein